jgi:hypothetical protein
MKNIKYKLAIAAIFAPVVLTLIYVGVTEVSKHF